MIDAHHHIWRQVDLPWLLGPEQPRIFGPYAPIKRDYLLDEFQKDLGKTGIKRSVYVQANWAPNWAADEVAWVQANAGQTIAGIVGYADMTAGDVRAVSWRRSSITARGCAEFRQQFHWHENPLYRFAPGPAQLRQATPCESNIQRKLARLWTGASICRCSRAR